MRGPHKFVLMLVSTPYEPVEYERICALCGAIESQGPPLACYQVSFWRWLGQGILKVMMWQI